MFVEPPKPYEGLDSADPVTVRLEREADRFAARALIPPRYERRLRELRLIDIPEFADQLRIVPAIVVGRMQHDGLLPYNLGHDIRRQFEFDEDLEPPRRPLGTPPGSLWGRACAGRGLPRTGVIRSDHVALPGFGESRLWCPRRATSTAPAYDASPRSPAHDGPFLSGRSDRERSPLPVIALPRMDLKWAACGPPLVMFDFGRDQVRNVRQDAGARLSSGLPKQIVDSAQLGVRLALGENRVSE